MIPGSWRGGAPGLLHGGAGPASCNSERGEEVRRRRRDARGGGGRGAARGTRRHGDRALRREGRSLRCGAGGGCGRRRRAGGDRGRRRRAGGRDSGRSAGGGCGRRRDAGGRDSGRSAGGEADGQRADLIGGLQGEALLDAVDEAYADQPELHLRYSRDVEELILTGIGAGVRGFVDGREALISRQYQALKRKGEAT